MWKFNNSQSNKNMSIMKRIILMVMSLMVMLVATNSGVYAKSKSPQKQVTQKSAPSKSTYKGSPVTVVKSPAPKSVAKLPSNRYSVKHNGVDYYRSGSKFYKMVNGRFVLTVLPFGLRVPMLPVVHTVIRFNNHNYYCAEGVIYQESGDEFEVVEPQMGMIVPELPEYNVNIVSINSKTYSEFDGVLYEQIPTTSGLQYKVVGTLDL